LTARELEVADLVSQGQTNHQIARRLSVSHKTVEAHLAHIFTKLDVSSRAAVASKVAEAKAWGEASKVETY
jgi:DNA-binding NarL/FixJ family response regulator